MRLNLGAMRDGKPHFSGGGVLVRYILDLGYEKDQAFAAAFRAARTRWGEAELNVTHIPYSSCTGCNDPNCTYDANPGYVCMKPK